MKIITTTSSFGKSDRAPLDILVESGLEITVNPWGKTLNEEEISEFFHREKPVGMIAGLEPLNREILSDASSHLKVISRCGTGLDNVDLEAAQALGITVCNTPEAPAEAVAELTIGFIFDLLRNITFHNQAVRAGFWTKRMGRLLSETTVGIMGLGRIGKRVAGFLEKLGTTVYACDSDPDQAWLAAHQVTLVSAEEILPACDLISLHLPYASGELFHFINSDRIKKMKRGSFLVNTSRGGLVDDVALADALTSGHLAGAAIDTFEQEPYKGILHQHGNIILSPHTGSYAKATRVRMEMEAAQNLVHALQMQ